MCAGTAMVALSSQANLPAVFTVIVLSTGAAIFYLHAWLHWVVTGRQRLIYYHHMAAVLAETVLLAHLLNQSVLAGLDLACIGVGLFLAFGRIGCLCAGCCYGRPWSKGISYSTKHVRKGFPPYLTGVKLLPVQALESAGVLILVVAGIAVVVADGPAGSALVVYCGGYALLRFGLEFLRGDPDRPYFRGYSEAQVTSLAMAAGIAAGGLTGVLPGGYVPIIPPGAMAVSQVLRFRGESRAGLRRRLLHPRHIKEMASALQRMPESSERTSSARRTRPEITRTSQGLILSRAAVYEGETMSHHIAFSYPPGIASEKLVRRLSGCLALLGGGGAGFRHYPGRRGVHHVLIPVEGSGAAR